MSHEELKSRLRAGDVSALEELFAACRGRLRQMVAVRMDRRLQGRLDPSDVLQEAFLEAAQRFKEFASTDLAPYLWLRLLTHQRLLLLRRQHLEVQARDARCEQGLGDEVSAEGLAGCLIDSGTTPGSAAVRAEARARLTEALDTMEPLDREMLALRHFEQLSNAEAAELLGLRPGAASQRYYRALKRLREILAGLPGGLEAL